MMCSRMYVYLRGRREGSMALSRGIPPLVNRPGQSASVRPLALSLQLLVLTLNLGCFAFVLHAIRPTLPYKNTHLILHTLRGCCKNQCCRVQEYTHRAGFIFTRVVKPLTTHSLPACLPFFKLVKQIFLFLFSLQPIEISF